MNTSPSLDQCDCNDLEILAALHLLESGALRLY